MKDEIKEILEEPEDCKYTIDNKDARIILDYITNLQEKIKQYEDPEDLTLFYMWLDEKAKDKMKQLQEENERLKQNLSKGITNNLENKYLNNKLYKDLEDYKTRNEKAIEYIKSSIENSEPDLYNDDLDDLHILLNILQGKSDE